MRTLRSPWNSFNRCLLSSKNSQNYNWGSQQDPLFGEFRREHIENFISLDSSQPHTRFSLGGHNDPNKGKAQNRKLEGQKSET